MVPFRARLARHLRSARRRRGLTQEQLADMVGCGVRTVQRAEAGSSMPGDEVICAWEECCGVELLPSLPR